MDPVTTLSVQIIPGDTAGTMALYTNCTDDRLGAADQFAGSFPSLEDAIRASVEEFEHRLRSAMADRSGVCDCNGAEFCCGGAR